MITLEIRAKQAENKSEGARLQKILNLADHSKAKNLSSVLSEFVGERRQFFQSAGKEAASRNSIEEDRTVESQNKRYEQSVLHRDVDDREKLR